MEANEIDEVDPKGDVVLICGNKTSESSNKIRVSSYVLSLGSKVFWAMLGPHFKEGHALRSTSSLELPLPDDDQEIIAIVCRAMHMRHDLIPEKLDLLMLKKIVSACDKYDCTTALKPTAESWITGMRQDSQAISDLHALLSIAWSFQSLKTVRSLAIDLIMKGGGDVADARKLAPTGSAGLSDVIVKIVKATSHYKTRIAVFISNEVDRRLTNSDCTHTTVCYTNCTALAVVSSNLANELRNKDLWPLSCLGELTIEQTLENMKAMQVKQVTAAKACSQSQCAYHWSRSLDLAVSDIQSEAKKICADIGRFSLDNVL